MAQTQKTKKRKTADEFSAELKRAMAARGLDVEPITTKRPKSGKGL